MKSLAERRSLALMLAPFLIGLCGLVFLPAALTFGLALFDYDLIQPAEYIGVANFSELMSDSVFWQAVRNSLLYIAFAVPLRLFGALGLALLLHRRFRGVGFHRAAAYLPTVVPDMSYALLWLWLLNPLYGPINLFLDAVGLPTPSWLTDPTAARAAVVIMGTFQIGEGFLVAMVTRQAIPAELYDIAELEGSNARATLRTLTLPLMAPTLILLMFRDTIFSFQASFGPALIVTKGGPPPHGTTFLPLFVYRNGFEYLRYGHAAAATLAMFILTAAIVAIQFRLAKRWRRTFA